MIKINMDKDTLEILCPLKNELNLNALNYIAMEKCKYFIKVKYIVENNKHIFQFSVNPDLSFRNQIASAGFEGVLLMLKDYCAAVRNLEQRQLDIKKIRLDLDCIFAGKDYYRFVYLPVIGGKEISLKKAIKNILSYVNTEDERIKLFHNKVKKLKTDEEILRSCSDFVSQHLNLPLSEQDADPKVPVQQDDETTILWETDGETTILSQQDAEETVPVQQDNETTILRETDGETTILSQQDAEETVPVQQDDETTILQETDGETTVLSVVSEHSDVLDDWDFERTTQFMQNEFSESETTLFSAQQLVGEYNGADTKASGDGQYVLNIINNQTGDRVVVRKNIFTIGKDVHNMDYPIHNNSVSKSHATITYEQGSYYIMDNKSTNGTMIEGVMLQPYEKAELYNGSIVTLGNVGLQIIIERG